MAAAPISRELSFEPVDNSRLANIVGPMDENLHQIEQRLRVRIYRRGGRLAISATDELAVAAAEQVLQQLYDLSSDENLTPDRVHLCVQEASMNLSDKPIADADGQTEAKDEARDEEVIVHTQRVACGSRSESTAISRQHSRQRSTFGIGPAGTGKNYLAVACAVDAAANRSRASHRVGSPAVEAGERLGFLPGDLTQKVDPYLRRCTTRVRNDGLRSRRARHRT